MIIDIGNVETRSYNEMNSIDNNDSSRVRAQTSMMTSLIPRIPTFSLTYKIAADRNHNGAAYMEIRDFIIYIYFLAMLMTLTCGVYTPNAYHLTSAIKNSFIEKVYFCGDEKTNFHNVSSIEDVWCFMKQRLMTSLKEHPFWGARGTKNETLLLTAPRLRQVRVQRQECLMPITSQGCYPEFLSNTEEKGPHKSTAYSPPQEMGHMWFHGLISYYNSAGYYFMLEEEKQLTSYEQNGWIDEQTRALFIDFTLYNINTNLFCVCQILFEFPPSGGVKPSYLFNTLKFIRYNDEFDHIVLACEIVFAFLSCYYTLELGCDMIYFKQNFFKMFDNWVDFLITFLSWTSIGILIYREYACSKFTAKHLMKKNEEFHDYQVQKYIQLTSDRITAVTLFCVFMKGYRFLHFDTIQQLFTTLRYCFWDMANFCFLFSVILFAYAEVGTLIFSNYLESYRTMQESAFTLLRIMMGEFRYQEIRHFYSFLGPLYIVSFVIVVVFLLLNMLLAIINATYSAVSSNVKVVRKTEYLPFLKHCASIILKRFHPKLVSEEHKKTNTDRIKEMLIESGFSELEVDMFFSRYTVDNDREVPEEVFQKIVTKKVKHHHIDDLKQRINNIEQSFNIVLAKKEYFLDKVAQLTRR